MTITQNGKIIELRLPSRLELLGVVDKLADGITEHMDFEDVDKDAVAISVIEACTNAIQHGNDSDITRSVLVVFEMQDDALTISIEDDGQGFQPADKQQSNPPDLLATRGRGIFIMREMMDEVDFDFSKGTKVSLVKRRTKSGKEEDAAK